MWHVQLNQPSCSYFIYLNMNWTEYILKEQLEGRLGELIYIVYFQRCWQMQKKLHVSFYDIINWHIIPHSISLPVLLLESSLLYISHLILSPHPGCRLMQSFFQRRLAIIIFALWANLAWCKYQTWPKTTYLRLPRLTSLNIHRWCLAGKRNTL